MLASGGSQGLVVGLFKYALRRSVARCWPELWLAMGFDFRVGCVSLPHVVHVSFVPAASCPPICLPSGHHVTIVVVWSYTLGAELRSRMWFVVVESLNVCCFSVSFYTVRVYCVRWLDATCTDFLTSHTGFVREVASMPSQGALTSCYSLAVCRRLIRHSSTQYTP